MVHKYVSVCEKVGSKTLLYPTYSVVATLPQKLSREASLEVLLAGRAVALLDDPPITQAANALCDFVGDLALALAVMARYLEDLPNLSLGDYLTSLQAAGIGHSSLGANRRPTPTGHTANINATFALSYDRLVPSQEKYEVALRLLHLAAQCAPAVPIPRQLLRRSIELSGITPFSEVEFGEAILKLVNLSLIEELQNGSLLLHKLLTEYVRTRSHQQALERSTVRSAIINELDRVTTAWTPQKGNDYLIHAQHLLPMENSLADLEDATLLTSLGKLVEQRGDYNAALPLYKHALAIRNERLGSTNGLFAASLHNLANLLHELGDNAEARSLHEQALDIRLQLHGDFHLETAESFDSLASVCYA